MTTLTDALKRRIWRAYIELEMCHNDTRGMGVDTTALERSLGALSGFVLDHCQGVSVSPVDAPLTDTDAMRVDATEGGNG